MTRPATALFGLIGTTGAAGTTRRGEVAIDASGAAACDAALADARLRPEQWQRRASLTRSRALHELTAGNAAAAVATLDAADGVTAGRDDALYRRSIGLGNQMIRGHALHRIGRDAEAAAIGHAVHRERPFVRQTNVAAALLVTGGDQASANLVETQRWIARLEPNFVDVMFGEAIDRRAWADAIALYPAIVPPSRFDRGMSVAEQRYQRTGNELRAMLHKAVRGGELAYALSATGNDAGADAALAETRAAIAALTPAAIPAPAAGVREDGSNRDRRERNDLTIRTAAEAQSIVDVAETIIARRRALAAGRWTPRPEGWASVRSGTSLDLLTLERASAPEAEHAAIDSAISALQTALAPAAAGENEAIAVLARTLPHIEVADRLPRYATAGGMAGFFASTDSGFKVEDQPDGSTLVSFTGDRTSAAVVEELALLRAAELARERGKTGLVVRRRQDFERTISNGYRTDPDGYVTELTVDFVDQAALPAALAATPWRVIPADEVIGSLAPVYRPPVVSAQR